MEKFILLFLISISFVTSAENQPLCIPKENFCKRCNQLTNLCISCEYDVLKPDKLGGCTGKGKCSIGKNYCEECDEEEGECKKCSSEYFPDENGGCSYSPNCEVSYLGKCIKCAVDFILVGDKNSIQMCKSINSEEFLNCEKIDYTNGQCLQCEEDYYLTTGDKKCIKTKNCHESIYGKCIVCKDGYYLDHKDKNKCKSTADLDSDSSLVNCLETEDGKTCTKCRDGYYFLAGDKTKCFSINYCSENGPDYCEKCADDYNLTPNKLACVSTKHCLNGDKDSGVCLSCDFGYYLDLSSRKCKSNTDPEDDLYKCLRFDEKCLQCDMSYYLSEDNKCTNSDQCEKGEGGKCTKCKSGYHLGKKDSRCSNVKKCVRSFLSGSCDECDEGYYLKKYPAPAECKPAEDVFENCLESNYFDKFCTKCREGYYLWLDDNLCRDNTNITSQFYNCELVLKAGERCDRCVKGFYVSKNDGKCSDVEFCGVAEEGKCLKCKDGYCLDKGTNTCVKNTVINEEKKFLYNCLVSNKKGSKCAECAGNYTLTEDGFCYNDFQCEDLNDDGVCEKCIEKTEDGKYLCVNEDYGCVETSENKHCLKCDDVNDFEKCSKCVKGYKPNKDGVCKKE